MKKGNVKVLPKKRGKNDKPKGRSMNILLLLILLVLGGYAFMSSPIFNVKDIEVFGNKEIETKTLIEDSGINQGSNIFSVRLSKVGDKLKDNIRIKDITLERKLPSQINIHVKERMPLLLVPVGSTYAEIDRDGVLLSYIDNISFKNLPVLTETKVKKVKIGEYISETKVKLALSTLAQMPQDFLGNVSEVNIGANENIKIYLMDNKIVYLGNEPVDVKKKLGLLQSILTSIRDKNLDVAYIDLRVLEKPVVKMKK